MLGMDDRLPLPAALAGRIPAVAQAAVRRLQVVEERWITRGSLANALPQGSTTDALVGSNLDPAWKEG